MTTRIGLSSNAKHAYQYRCDTNILIDLEIIKDAWGLIFPVSVIGVERGVGDEKQDLVGSEQRIPDGFAPVFTR